MKFTLADETFKKLFEKYPLYSQNTEENPIIVVKLFDILGSGTWYLTEYCPKDNIAFGYVTGLQYDEWGSISITELEELKHPIFPIPRIERELHFTPKPFHEVVPYDLICRAYEEERLGKEEV